MTVTRVIVTVVLITTLVCEAGGCHRIIQTILGPPDAFKDGGRAKGKGNKWPMFARLERVKKYRENNPVQPGHEWWRHRFNSTWKIKGTIPEKLSCVYTWVTKGVSKAYKSFVKYLLRHSTMDLNNKGIHGIDNGTVPPGHWLQTPQEILIRLNNTQDLLVNKKPLYKTAD